MEKKKEKDQPEEGKQYALTGRFGSKCIANGNTWAESEVKPAPMFNLKKKKGV